MKRTISIETTSAENDALDESKDESDDMYDPSHGERLIELVVRYIQLQEQKDN